MKADENAEHLLSIRKHTNLYLLQNPNYFGTIPDVGLNKIYKPVYDLKYKSYYEQLGCVSYNPVTEKLNAVVVVKRASGYLGTPCQGGSKEYVRFYVDYNNNGNWIDEGVVSVGVYDHNFDEDLCYDVELKITPKIKHCCDKKPVLPRVKAILSWNLMPPANHPNWNFIWGDVKEENIQIAPRKDWFCLFTHFTDLIIKDKKALDVINESKLIAAFEKNNPQLKELSAGNQIELTVAELKRLYGKDVEDHRILHSTIDKLSLNLTAAQLPLELSNLGIDWDKVNDFIYKPVFNTSYEEVHCVSLNKDQNALHAVVEIKRDTGYSGGLCTKGSQEYVAFYMDFGAGWIYMGTSSGNVHDIPGAGAKKLQYDISLPVNIEKYRKEWCTVGKAKVKAILSWNVPPPPFSPNYTAHWGDWEEAFVEIKPLPKGVTPGVTLPFIEKFGGMVVTDINPFTGLATTSGGSSSLPGANQSPFDGRIEIVGHIFNLVSNMKYRFLITEPGGAVGTLNTAQNIDTDFNGAITPHTLIPDADGWYDYLGVGGNNIVGGKLADFYPSVEGKYKITIEAKDVFNVIHGGNSVVFVVDKKAPDVTIDITNGSGNCGLDFKPGDTLEGTYTTFDEHVSGFSIYMTPAKPGTSIEIDGLAVSSVNLPTTVTSKAGTWKLYTTAGVTPTCGYNIRIDGGDRTIVNSGYIGHSDAAIQGFCLNK